MSLQRLRDLDRSPAQFPDRLTPLLRGGHAESIQVQALPEDEFAGVINDLDDVRFIPPCFGNALFTWHPQIIRHLDHTGQRSRKCLRVLQEICGVRGTLPASYQFSGALSFTSEHPVAFGGFGDVFKGKIGAGADVCIKKIRRCVTDNVGEVRKASHRFSFWLDSC